MKRFYLTIFMTILLSNPAYCEGFGYKYIDQGGIYTNATLPSSVAKEINLNSENGIVNVADKNIDLSSLKKGVSSKANILGLIETGNAGIMAAARNGGISQILYSETKKTKVYIPLGFIPIYVDTLQTTVYGR